MVSASFKCVVLPGMLFTLLTLQQSTKIVLWMSRDLAPFKHYYFYSKHENRRRREATITGLG